MPDKSPFHSLLKRQMTRKEFLGWTGIAVASIFGLGGVAKMIMTHAATPVVALEPEAGTAASPASVIADATASGGKAIQFGSSPTTPEPAAGNLYRPYQITDPKSLPNAPKDANYVIWNFPAETTLYQAFQGLGSNDILVLPERAQPYEIDSSGGFVNDSNRYYAMARAKRGLVGLGPGVIVQPSASNFSAGRSAFGGNGNQNRIIEATSDGSYFGNFEMRGRDFGGVQYDAIVQSGNNAVWERIYFNGAHRGWMNGGDGECAAVSGAYGANQQALNCEIECRDSNGTRVATSPLMFNAQSNPVVTDVYAHHSVSGMPTFWKVNNVTTTRLRSEYNGSGSGTLSGSGINHELVTGTVTHNDPTIIIHYASNGGANTGLHISIDTINAVYNIINPTFDPGPAGPDTFAISVWSGGDQSLLHVRDAAGRNIPFQVY